MQRTARRLAPKGASDDNLIVRVYLDICCLKRPFDDLTEPRVRLEAEAVLEILVAPSERVSFVRSPAHELENRLNPVRWRAARVHQWLASLPTTNLDVKTLSDRTAALMRLGFKGFDAFHLACAEGATADVFATTDDRLINQAVRSQGDLKIRVTDPVTLAREVFA